MPQPRTMRRDRERTRPQVQTRAAFVPASVNEEQRTIDVIWTTGAEGERCEWDGEVWLESLRVDDASCRLGRLNAGAPVLNAHQQYNGLSDQIGVVERAWIEDGVGHATVRFSSRPEVEPFWRDVVAGIIRNISVGYVVYRYEPIESTADGQPARMLAVDWEPMEISFVPVPFDVGSQVRGGASPRMFTAKVTQRTKGKTKMARTVQQIRSAITKARAALAKARELADENKIVEAQTDLEELAAELEDVLGTLEQGTGEPLEGEDGDGMPNAPPVAGGENAAEDGSETDPEKAAEERGRKAEIARQSGIRALARTFPGAVTAEALEGFIARGLTVAAAQTAVLAAAFQRQAAAGTINGVHNGAGGQDNTRTLDAMAQAILHRAAPGRHQLQGEARNFRGFNLIDMGRRCIEMQGGRTDGLSRREIAQLALNVAGRGLVRTAGMQSTSDFPQILGNTIDRALRTAYEATTPTWQPLGRQDNVNDFRQRTIVALGDAAALEKVYEGGEYKYGKLPEEGSTYKVDKYGKIIAFTWEAMINDDLGAFDRVPAALAEAARQTESNIVWSLLLGNPNWIDGQPIYSAAHGNVAASGGPITIDSLAAARAAMRKQKGLSGQNFINITPRYLVVGPDRELEAYQFTSASYFPAQNGDINPVFNTQLAVIVEPRITDGSWYLVGDGADTFVYSYLEGEGGMFTETREGFEVDGVEVKGRLVFGAAYTDYRALYKNAGA